MNRDSQGYGCIQLSGFKLWSRRLALFLVLISFCFLANKSYCADEKSIERFRDAILKLGPNIDPAEAEAVSLTSHRTARRLAQEYRVVGPAVFQNFLIHVGA